MALAEQMRRRQISGIAVKEELSALLPSPPHPQPLSPEYGGEGSKTPREGDA